MQPINLVILDSWVETEIGQIHRKHGMVPVPGVMNSCQS